MKIRTIVSFGLFASQLVAGSAFAQGGSDVIKNPSRWRVTGGVQWRTIGDVDFESRAISNPDYVPSLAPGSRRYNVDPGSGSRPDDRVYDNGYIDHMTLKDIAADFGINLNPGMLPLPPPIAVALVNLDVLSTHFGYENGNQVNDNGFVISIPPGLAPVPINILGDTISFTATLGSYSRSTYADTSEPQNWSQDGGASYGPYVRADYFIDNDGSGRWGYQVAVAYHTFNAADTVTTFNFREDVAIHKYGVIDTFFGISSDIASAGLGVGPGGVNVTLPQFPHAPFESGTPPSGVLINLPELGRGELITYVADAFGVDASAVPGLLAASGIDITDLGRRDFDKIVRREHQVAWNEVYESVDVDLATVSLGVTGEKQEGPLFLSGSVGITPNLVQLDADRKESLYTSINDGPATHLRTWKHNESKVVFTPGLYLQAGVGVAITPSTRAELFGRYDLVDEVDESVGPTDFEVDLSGGSVGTTVTILL